MLGVLNQDQLRRSYFPLGDSRKAEVRAEARERGLAVADKPDSHDICFIANGDTAGFLEQRLGNRPGDIVDVAGAKVGEHAGSHQFTIGQRRGLRLGTPAAGRPAALRAGHHTDHQHHYGRAAGCARGSARSARSGRPGRTGPRTREWSGEVQVRAHGHPWRPRSGCMIERSGGGRWTRPPPVSHRARRWFSTSGSRVVGSATISATRA